MDIIDPPHSILLDVTLYMATWKGNSPKTTKNCSSIFVKIGQLPILLKHGRHHGITNKEHPCSQGNFCGCNF